MTAEQPQERDVPQRWTPSTVYLDMWVDPADDPRGTGMVAGGERAVLQEYLRRNRLTLELKCADLDAEQMASRSVPPSTMSLLGLVRHMAEVERHWFRREMAGQEVPHLYRTSADGDGEWNGAVADAGQVEQAWRTWRGEVANADQFVADAVDLDITGTSGMSLREVLVHMIEEYARHCGHADLLRERIDGRIGQ